MPNPKVTKNKKAVPLARVAQLRFYGVGYTGYVAISGKVVYLSVQEIRRRCSIHPSNKDITPVELGKEWLSGTGPRERTFTNGDYVTELLRQHEHIQDAKKKIREDILHNRYRIGAAQKYPYGLSGIKGVGKYIRDYSTLCTFGQTGNLAVTYLGSFRMEYTITEVKGHRAKVKFEVTNSSSMESALRPPVIGYTELWKNSVGKTLNEIFENGPGSKTSQTIIWYEEINLK